ncbi:MAG: hypothetical protein BWY52_00429 [Chloroflexi bacterium ADurb.Bin325]|nr:MAG: hypothetical protein BWY52_00429 [Chloroflexi bacterium ADurb.Bin325]
MAHIALSKKERLRRQTRGQEIDRIPSLAGWIGGVRVLSDLAGISADEYLADPLAGVVKAALNLDADGMIQPTFPTKLEQIRTGLVEESHYAGIEPEALLDRADSLPDNERDVLSTFDAAAEERRYRDYFEKAFRDFGGIEPVPNFWEIGGHFPLYTEFGYTAFLLACKLYPEAVGKIWWVKSVRSRERAKILVRLYREYDLVPLMFCGEDLANNKGPMVSPAFLRQHYLPTVRMIIEPLVDAGVRLIHHCDGDVRPLVADYLAVGFSGFQGFQYELGIDPYALRRMRSPLGEEPLFFAGLSVSRTLPFGAAADVRDEVDYFIDFTDGGKGLFLMTSNVTGVEVPPDNLRVAYRYIKEWDPTQPRTVRWTRWPWGETHD